MQWSLPESFRLKRKGIRLRQQFGRQTQIDTFSLPRKDGKSKVEYLDPLFRKELRKAYIEGKTGKPCSIYPQLAEQASPEEIKRAADALPIGPNFSRLVKKSANALCWAYMKVWQIGRRHKWWINTLIFTSWLPLSVLYLINRSWKNNWWNT